MRDKLQVAAFILFALLLAVSVMYNLTIKQVSLVGWPEILLIAALVFVAIGDKITKLAVTPQGVSIEQTVEQEVKELEKGIQKIDRFVEEDNPDEAITDIVADTLEYTRDTWSRLLLIRMILRRLLRKIADAHELTFSPTSSISSMTSALYQQGIIDSLLSEQVEKIRGATFLVEWGAGEEPRSKDVKFTLENYSTVFNSLKARAQVAKRRAG